MINRRKTKKISRNFLCIALTLVQMLILMLLLGVVAGAEEKKNEEAPASFQQVNHFPIIPSKYAMESLNKELEIAKLDEMWLTQDNDGDAILDYAVMLNPENFSKYREGLDNNNDGFIDDFSYYDETGLIEYQEIDSNFDKKMDIWVEIEKGERVVHIQRDVDYDGKVDQEFK